MPNQKQLQSLKKYKPREGPALTIYFTPSKLGGANRLINKLAQLSPDSVKFLSEEINAIKNLVESSPPESRGMAIFASKDRFETYPLPEPPPRDLIAAGKRWVIFPMYFLRQFYPPTLLEYEFKDKTELYKIDKNIKRLMTAKGEDKQSRHKKISERIHVERSKTDQNYSILKYAPAGLRLFARAKSPKVLRKTADSLNRKTHRKMLKMKIEESVCGLSARKVLSELNTGKLKSLVINISKTIPGAICQKCGLLIPARVKGCQACGGRTERQTDITEEIFRTVKENGLDVLLTTRRLPNSRPILGTHILGDL